MAPKLHRILDRDCLCPQTRCAHSYRFNLGTPKSSLTSVDRTIWHHVAISAFFSDGTDFQLPVRRKKLESWRDLSVTGRPTLSMATEGGYSVFFFLAGTLYTFEGI